MAGASSHPIPHTHKATRRHVPTGKKLPNALAQVVGSFAKSQPLRLMFQDEARFGRISDCRYCWAPYPLRPTVKAMLTHQYVYAYAAVSRWMAVWTAWCCQQSMVHAWHCFFAEVARRHPKENIVMVLDGAGWHHGAMALPPNLKLHFLPPYSPELNPVGATLGAPARSTSTIAPSTAWMLWREHLVDALRELESHPDIAKVLPFGHGSLMLFLTLIRIMPSNATGGLWAQRESQTELFRPSACSLMDFDEGDAVGGFVGNLFFQAIQVLCALRESRFPPPDDRCYAEHQPRCALVFRWFHCIGREMPWWAS